MPTLADLLGLGQVVGGAVGETIAPDLIDAYNQQRNESRLNAQAMMAAGGAMLAGNKGNYGAAGPAIGEGVMAGEATYQKAQALQQAEAIKRQQVLAHLARTQQIDNWRKQQLEIQKQRNAESAELRREGFQVRKDIAGAQLLQRADELELKALEAKDRSEQARLNREAAMLREQAAERRHMATLGENIRHHKETETHQRSELLQRSTIDKITLADGSMVRRLPSGEIQQLLPPGSMPVKESSAYDQLQQQFKKASLAVKGTPEATTFPKTLEDWVANTESGKIALNAAKQKQGLGPPSGSTIDPSMFKTNPGFGNVQVER